MGAAGSVTGQHPQTAHRAVAIEEGALDAAANRAEADDVTRLVQAKRLAPVAARKRAQVGERAAVKERAAARHANGIADSGDFALVVNRAAFGEGSSVKKTEGR